MENNVDSHCISPNANEDETNDALIKHPIELNRNYLSNNQVNVVYNITIIIEVNNKKGKDTEDAKIKIIAKLYSHHIHHIHHIVMIL